jgi:hypothetical protein
MPRLVQLTSQPGHIWTSEVFAFVLSTENNEISDTTEITFLAMLHNPPLVLGPGFSGMSEKVEFEAAVTAILVFFFRDITSGVLPVPPAAGSLASWWGWTGLRANALSRVAHDLIAVEK